ncbi:MAG: hypothetical protein HQK97_04010 [Nitrospirae bacterium]|nr:hypothetical protein [Nitrospirota bacterium]
MDNAVAGAKYSADVSIVAKAIDYGRFSGQLALKLVDSVPSVGDLRSMATPAYNPPGTGQHINTYA